MLEWLIKRERMLEGLDKRERRLEKDDIGSSYSQNVPNTSSEF